MINAGRGIPCALAFIAGCSLAGQATETDRIFNAGLQKAFQNHEQTLEKQRPPLRFISGTTVETCREYLAKTETEAVAEGVDNRTVSGEYLVCDSVAALNQGKKTGGIQYSPESYGKQLMARLDLRTFSSSLGPRVTDEQYTLADLALDAVDHSRFQVVFDSKNWHFALEVVASRDLNGNGRDDWLLWLVDEAKAGNYRDYEVLVAYDVGSSGPIQVEPFSP
ncbi:hypothetical protein [Halospina sp. K52047b]|uniref:hypothetical protein n=1 Tax=Halospina sp. K52047b TaxID=2614160 RepID=UPI001249C356|nr:hypothetical protein [Halospina sp. K52047b]KAA8982884.1 hypothetical protein F3089_07100 [Halospina sp. K52047b]